MNDIKNIKNVQLVYTSISSMGELWLPIFMIEDRLSLQELIDRWLVETKEIGNYKTPTVFLTNDLTRLQAIADLMFPLSSQIDLQSEKISV